MTSKLLQGLAITFGGGLAFGMGFKLGQTVRRRDDEPGIDLSPVDQRFDGLNQRFQELDSALRHSNGRIDSVNQRMDQLEIRLPAEIPAAVQPRIDELGRQLEKDFEQSQNRSLDTLVRTLETRLLQRISGLESSLSGQSEAIEELREKSLRTDRNMEKLLLAVEKFCERTERQEAPAATASTPPGVLAEKSSSEVISESTPAWPASRESGPESLTALEQNSSNPALESETVGAPEIRRSDGIGLDFLKPEEPLAAKWRRRFGFS